jgi:hypothetical protein
VDSVRLARVAGLFAVALLVVAPTSAALAEGRTLRLTVLADTDDDDANGLPDGEQATIKPAGRVDLVPLDRRYTSAVFHATSGGEHARIVVDGAPIAWDKPLPGTPYIQGLSPGVVSLVASFSGRKEEVQITVRGVSMRDGAGAPVDMARSHASIERTPPARVDPGPAAPYQDPDALRFVLSIPDDGGAANRELPLESVSSLGTRLDVLPHLEIDETPCTPLASGLRCFASAPVRFVLDDVDRNHPLVAARSIKAEVGGAIMARLDGKKAQQIRVLGPRSSSVGPIGRLRARLRPFVVRIEPRGAPAIGSTDAGAVAAMRAELASASAIWGQCGLAFGSTRTIDVKIVDPPPAYLLSIGDDVGLPASGGSIRVKIDGHEVVVPIAAGAGPDAVASDFARAVDHAGLVATVSPNARIAPGAEASVDVMVKRKDGALVAIEPSNADGMPSDDATMSVRIGSVDLSDGLQHFTDMDAMAGTLEERTLLKSVDDGDPQTIEIVVVPMFAGGGRIGESFIESDLSSLRNVVLLDRAGIRARKSSLTLAHELGHVLMDMPGHPDDYGFDSPTLLMDSDASDASPFGPRRLAVEECARMIRQAGPKSRVPLMTEWPLDPIPADTRPLVGN